MGMKGRFVQMTISMCVGLSVLACALPLSAAAPDFLSEERFPAFEQRVEEIWGMGTGKWNDPINFRAIADMGKHVVDSTPSAIMLKHQQAVYMVCMSLFEIRDYSRAIDCFQVLKPAVEKNGDLKKSKYVNWFDQKYIVVWPILPKIEVFMADMFLELGQFKKALSHAMKAQEDMVRLRNVLGEPEHLFYDKYFPLGAATHLTSTLAITYQQTGDHKRAMEELAKLVTWAAIPLNKDAKTRAESMLIKTHLALGNYRTALGIVKGKSEASDRASDAVQVIAFSVLMAILNPVEAAVRGGDALAGTLFGDMHTLETRFMFAHAHLEVDELAAAKPELDQILANPAIKGMGGIHWAALYDRGRIAEKESKTDEAIRYYSQAIEEIERQRTTINTEGAKIGFFGDKQAVYQSLVRLLFQSGQHEQAFLMGERSKSRALVDMLANKQDFHVPAQDAQKVQQLLASAQVGETRLNRTAADETAAKEFAQRSLKTDGAKPDVGAVLGELRNLKRNAQEQLATQYADLASLVSVPHVSLAEITQALPADETLVSYYYDAKHLYAYVIDKAGLKAVKLNREGLEDEVQALRQTIQKRGAFQPPAKALHDRLIAPLADKLTGKKLLIAGHGVLHYLPFAALSNGQQFLVERYQLAFLPSASTLKFVGNIATQNKPGVLLAFGNPDLGDKQYDLAFAEKEAREVGGLFGNSKVLLRKEASKQNLKEYGTGFRYLHFATHGKFEAANPLGSSLLLASNSVDNLADRLTIGELYSMRLDADLVTLSACETGLGDIANGDDVVGLVRGFLYAGANQVISTLWEIDDAATSQLMTNFYRQIKDGKTSKGAALRNSQLATAKTLPHPYFWAAFQITGGAREAKKL